MHTPSDSELLSQAGLLAQDNVASGRGGPFGAVIVREGRVIATGTNQVLAENDPTAHAEVVAIRAATQALGRFDLSDCQIFSSCEPCPMCLGAIYWARLTRLVFANTQQQAAEIGFDDAHIYQELALPAEERCLPSTHLPNPAAEASFAAWAEKADKVAY